MIQWGHATLFIPGKLKKNHRALVEEGGVSFSGLLKVPAKV